MPAFLALVGLLVFLSCDNCSYHKPGNKGNSMGNELTTTNRNAHALTVPADLEAVREYVDASLAPNTRRAYRASWDSFRGWCEAENVDPLPASPKAVAAFLAAEANAGLKPATLGLRMAAICWAHEAKGYKSPTEDKGVTATLRGIRRTHGVKPNRKAAATVEILSAMVSHTDLATLKGKRDKALLLFGFASAMRRSELVALTVEDVEKSGGWLTVTLRRSKTDQEGQGHSREIHPGNTDETCPIKALEAWLEAARITEGPLFRSVTRWGQVGEWNLSANALADVVKHYAEKAGFDPARFAGHSLRAGFITSADEKGKPAARIMDHTGHKSPAMIAVYTRRTDRRRNHAGAGLL